MNPHPEQEESTDTLAVGKIAGVVDGSVITSFHRDGSVGFYVAVGQAQTEGDGRARIEIILDRESALAVLAACRRRDMTGESVTLPPKQCQVGLQWRLPRALCG